MNLEIIEQDGRSYIWTQEEFEDYLSKKEWTDGLKDIHRSYFKGFILFKEGAIRYEGDEVDDYKLESLKNGDLVSHEDYTSDLFMITHIDKESRVVTTKGGKNGTWVNHISMIITSPSKDLNNPFNFKIK